MNQRFPNHTVIVTGGGGGIGGATCRRFASEGARVAVLPDYTDDSVKARVRTYLKDGGLPASLVDDTAKTNVDVTATTIPVDVGGTVTASAARVVVEYPFEFMVLQPVAQLVQKLFVSLRNQTRIWKRKSLDVSAPTGQMSAVLSEYFESSRRPGWTVRVVCVPRWVKPRTGSLACWR